jgi:hypothetical protein
VEVVEGPRGSRPCHGALIPLYDDSDDAPRRGRNKGWPDDRRHVKLDVKRKTEQERFTSKTGEMINVKQRIAQEQLQTRKELAEKKHSENIRNCEEIREDEKRKAVFKNRRIHLEEEKEERHVMLMNPTTIDVLTKEW